jgi:hypothetical protein
VEKFPIVVGEIHAPPWKYTMQASGSASADAGVYMRKGNGPSGPGRKPFSIFPIGSFPSTICVSARAMSRACAGGSSHIFGCPEFANISNKFLTCVSSCTAFSRPAIVNVAVALIPSVWEWDDFTNRKDLGFDSSRLRSRQVNRKAFKISEFAASQCTLMRGAQDDPRRVVCFKCLLPTRGAQAPTVARFQARGAGRHCPSLIECALPRRSIP